MAAFFDIPRASIGETRVVEISVGKTLTAQGPFGRGT